MEDVEFHSNNFGLDTPSASKKLIGDSPLSANKYLVTKSPAPVQAGAYDHLINDDKLLNKEVLVPQAHLHIQDKINKNFNTYMSQIANL